MRVVFLNMADEEGVLSRKSVTALRQKYPAYGGWNPFRYFTSNDVEEIDLIPLYKKFKGGRLGFSDLGEALRIAISCDVADKILLGIHGYVGDATCGYVGKFGERSGPVNFRELAQFLLRFLTSRSECFNLGLIMCFGARAQDHLVDHDSALTERQVKSSFAYRFYKEICTLRHVRMTARTGAVSFSEHDGKSLVQSEAAVGAEVLFERLDERETEATRRYEDVLKRYAERGRWDAFSDTEERIVEEIEKGRTDWGRASSDELVIIQYHGLRRKVLGPLSLKKDESRSKYGKFVYYHRPGSGEVTVVRKYPPPESRLYRGAL
jgi:hypothetical protein